MSEHWRVSDDPSEETWEHVEEYLKRTARNYQRSVWAVLLMRILIVGALWEALWIRYGVAVSSFVLVLLIVYGVLELLQLFESFRRYSRRS